VVATILHPTGWLGYAGALRAGLRGGPAYGRGPRPRSCDSGYARATLRVPTAVEALRAALAGARFSWRPTASPLRGARGLRPRYAQTPVRDAYGMSQEALRAVRAATPGGQGHAPV